MILERAIAAWVAPLTVSGSSLVAYKNMSCFVMP